jgi:hypothetical protein
VIRQHRDVFGAGVGYEQSFLSRVLRANVLVQLDVNFIVVWLATTTGLGQEFQRRHPAVLAASNG